MKTDIFTILKNGFVPIDDMIAYAKTKGFNFDGFVYDDIDECYRYNVYFPLLWDGDSYDIDCTIRDPNPHEDETTAMVSFYGHLHIYDEEKRKVPTCRVASREFSVKTSEEFTDALDEWQYFLGEVYINFLTNRLEIIRDLDIISVNENKRQSTDIKQGYMTMMDRMIDAFNTNIQDIINFTYVTTDEEEV
jgi:hypothetical protein